MKALVYASIATGLLLAGPLGFGDEEDAVQSETAVRARALSLTGVVTDATTGDPLSGAQVFIDGTGHGALTNARGRYTILVRNESTLGSEVTLRVMLIGYTEARATVRTVGETVVTHFSLSRSAISLDELVAGEREADGSGRPVGNTVGKIRLRGQSTIRRTEWERDADPRAGVVAPTNQEVWEGTVLHGRRAPRHKHSGYGGERYARIVENSFLTARNEPLSTFSIDVDRASYANVRRFLDGGTRPPVDAVRIEEMVNYFTYDYPDARGRHPLSITTEVAEAPWRPEHRLVRIGIQGKQVDLEELPPSNLVFLIDVSGSMRPENKLPLLKRSFRMLVGELRPEDRVAIVVYAGAAGLVLPSTPGHQKKRILRAIDHLEAGGSTAGGAGIRLAYDVAAEHFVRGGNNRVILATDGDFNVGASSDADMVRLIEDKRRGGVFLTVLGFGMGNLKDSKMESIADHGNGNYAYIDNILEARKVLVTEMGGTLLTIAKDVKIQVEFNPIRVRAYRLIGYENRVLAAEDFNDDTKDAGELGAGHSVTALYEVVPADAEWDEGDRSVDPLRYQEVGKHGGEVVDRRQDDDFPTAFKDGARSDELMFVKLRYKRPNGRRSRLIQHPVRDRIEEASTNLRFAAAVAAFGMLLRDSEHSGDFALRDVERLAEGALGDDLHGYRSEFVRLVGAARQLRVLAMERH